MLLRREYGNFIWILPINDLTETVEALIIRIIRNLGGVKTMGIFDKNRVGRLVRCIVEKDGEQVIEFVKWVHATVGSVVKRKLSISKPSKNENTSNSFITVISDGWKVVEVDVERGAI